MTKAPTTTVDLGRLSLSHGEGTRLDFTIPLDPLEFGGQTYVPEPRALAVRLDVSRPGGGYAFRLSFPLCVEGPCARCLEPAAVESEVDVREVDQQDADDEELRSPYVVEGQLDIGRWAHDAAVLAMPARVLCRADCAGLCPVCGETLNDADPKEHRHSTTRDRRWAKLDELRGRGPSAGNL